MPPTKPDSKPVVDGSMNIMLNGVLHNGKLVPWALAFPRNYDIIFDRCTGGEMCDGYDCTATHA